MHAFMQVILASKYTKSKPGLQW